MKNNIYILTVFCSLVLLTTFCGCSNSNKKILEAFDTNLSKPELVYIYDPLCGWCYGFSPVISQLKANHSDKFKFTILTGGMVIGNPKDSIKRLQEFFSEAMPMLEENTTVKFGDGFKKTLQKGTAIFSSEKPALALTVYKSLPNGDDLAFAGSIQKALYYEGLEPDKDSTYLVLAKRAGANVDEFKRRMKDSIYYKKTWREFALTREMKVNGYPTVFLIKDGKLNKLTDGYMNYNELEAELLKYYNIASNVR